MGGVRGYIFLIFEFLIQHPFKLNQICPFHPTPFAKAQMNLTSKAMRFSNPNPTKSMPCAHVPLGLPCGCHMPGRPSPAVIQRHEREVMRRLAWCVRAGRTPAFGHMHEAPGDDGEFVVSFF